MDLDFLKDSLLTMFVVIDPPGLLPIFLTVTAGMTAKARMKAANKALLVSFCILAVAAIGGGKLLAALGISMPAFRIAGGLMLFYIAWEMIFNKREQRKSEAAETGIENDQYASIAIFPLAMPLIAGPGAMTATILMASQAEGTMLDYAVLLGMIIVVLATCWVVFRLSAVLDKLMGFSGRVILERMLGVLLAALAIQIVGDGIAAFIGALSL